MHDKHHRQSRAYYLFWDLDDQKNVGEQFQKPSFVSNRALVSYLCTRKQSLVPYSMRTLIPAGGKRPQPSSTFSARSLLSPLKKHALSRKISFSVFPSEYTLNFLVWNLLQFGQSTFPFFYAFRIKVPAQNYKI